MTSLANVLARLERVRSSGEGRWIARCPSHDDRDPSLSVAVGADGRVLLCCHAGCTVEEIVAAVGLTVGHLFDPDGPSTSILRTRPAPLPSEERLAVWSTTLLGNGTVERLRELRNWTAPVLEKLGLGLDDDRVVIPVRNAGGDLVNLLRFAPNPRGRTTAKMIALRGHPRELFPAPEAVEEGDGRVWICEGEPDAITATSIGLAAVGVPGVSGWRSAWGARFRGRRVVVVFDCDLAGRAATARVASDLASVAADVRVLDLDPSRDDGFDLTDFVGAARSDNELEEARRLLEECAESAPMVTASDAPVELDVDRGLDDIGNASRFVDQHGDLMRFVAAWGEWMRWDGARLAVDDMLEHRRRAKETARAIATEAAGEQDEQRRRDLLKHARATASEPRQRAMLAIAASAPGIVIRPAELDQDRWALNTSAGIVDLRTGTVRPNNPTANMTMIAGARWDPIAAAPLWDAHLRRCLVTDELIGFVQRLAGLSAIGETLEHVLAILHGTGANGKTVTVNAIAGALGDYAVAGTLDLLLQTGRAGGRATPELAELRGRRLVTVAESPQDGQLASERVKAITGGDPITARRLYGHPFTFAPSHTAWLATNHRPRVADDGDAIWRRIVLVPFTETIPEPEQDRRLGAKFAAESPGILRWIVDGARWYLRDGLNPPAAVTAATAEYRDDEDTFGDFLDERTVIEDGASVQAGHLLAAYDSWAAAAGAPVLTRNTLADKLHARGHERRRCRTGSRWHGLRLRHDDTLDQA